MMLLVGRLGSGKTMLARRLAGILPPMSFEETLDVTRIYSMPASTMLRADWGLGNPRKMEGEEFVCA
jgi:predicted ATPase with chaperone activity